MDDRPPCRCQSVEPLPVLAELSPFRVPVAVVLHGHPLGWIGQVDAGREGPVGTTHGELWNGGQPGGPFTYLEFQLDAISYNVGAAQTTTPTPQSAPAIHSAGR